MPYTGKRTYISMVKSLGRCVRFWMATLVASEKSALAMWLATTFRRIRGISMLRLSRVGLAPGASCGPAGDAPGVAKALLPCLAMAAISASLPPTINQCYTVPQLCLEKFARLCLKGDVDAKPALGLAYPAASHTDYVGAVRSCSCALVDGAGDKFAPKPRF